MISQWPGFLRIDEAGRTHLLCPTFRPSSHESGWPKSGFCGEVTLVRSHQVPLANEKVERKCSNCGLILVVCADGKGELSLWAEVS